MILHALPMAISIIDLGKGPGRPEMVSVVDPHSAHTIETRDKSGVERQVTVHSVRSYEAGYRRGAPP